MADAAERAAAQGVFAMVGFTYRRVPAATFARDLVAAGKHRRDPPGARRATCRTGSSTRPSRSPGACRRTSPAPARSATSAPTPSTSPSSSPACSSPSVSGTLETFVKRAPAARERRRASAARPAPRLGDGHRRRRRRCSPAASTRGVLGTFEATRFAHRAARTRCASRSPGSEGRDRLRPRGPQRAAVLRRAPRRPTAQGFTKIFVTEPEHPYVAAWWPAGHMLGYEHGVLAPGEGLRRGDRAGHAADAVVRRRPAGAARARRRRAQLRQRQRLDRDRLTAVSSTALTTKEDPMARPDHPVHRPVGRPAARRGREARLRLGLRRPRARLLGRPPRPVALGRARLRRGQARAAREVRPQGLGDLEPPQGPGRLRRPDRPAPPRHPVATRSGATATRRACASAPPRR